MPGTWRTRLDALEKIVGHGPLVGHYDVNQRYAAVQHVRLDYRHPRGGGPNFVSAPLRARYPAWYRDIAAGLLNGSAESRMADSMEDLDHLVSVLAPVDLNNLRQSGHPSVTSDGRPVYDRAARVPRLTDAELRARRRTR